MLKVSWFMYLTFQVPMQYCSLQHHTLLSTVDTFITESHSCFGLATSFLLELPVIVLCSPPVTCWTPSNLVGGGLLFRLIFLSFCLSPLSMGFSRQGLWSGLPFPSPVDHILSELFTMTHLSWVALHNMTHNFIELWKSLCQNKTMIHEGHKCIAMLYIYTHTHTHTHSLIIFSHKEKKILIAKTWMNL